MKPWLFPLHDPRKTHICVTPKNFVLALNSIWEQNAHITLPGKGKCDPDSLLMSILNVVALLNIPMATNSIINPTIPSKDAVNQNSSESCSFDPQAPDDTQVLNALPVCSIRSMAYQGLNVTTLQPGEDHILNDSSLVLLDIISTLLLPSHPGSFSHYAQTPLSHQRCFGLNFLDTWLKLLFNNLDQFTDLSAVFFAAHT